jgi:hypothetical protein
MASSGERSRPASLLRMIADGSAGAGTRLMASLSVGLLLTAAACVSSYILGFLVPGPYRSPSTGSRTTVYVDDDVAIVTFLIFAIAYLGALFWIWSRHRRKRAIWLGGVITVGIALIALLLCVLIDSAFSGDEEYLISGVLVGGAGLTIAVWTRLYHRHARGRSLYDENGVLALRCPSCEYSMVGLKEARCPECGQEFTLNELFSRQDFDILRKRGDASSDAVRSM